MDWSQSCVFLTLLTNQREGNPQSPGIHVNRKHHQVTKTPKKVSRNSGGCWKFTSPAFLWRSVGGKGVGEVNQTNHAKVTWPQEIYGTVKAGRKVSSTSVNLRVTQQLALLVSKRQLARDPFDPRLRTKLHTVGEHTFRSLCNTLLQFTNGTCYFLQQAQDRWQDVTKVGLQVETAHQAAVCGLITTVTPFETRNQHVLTSAPPEPAEQHVNSGTRAFYTYTAATSPGFPLHPLACVPLEWRSRPKRKPSSSATVFLDVYFDQMADTVLLQCISSELGGLDDETEAVSLSISVWLCVCAKLWRYISHHLHGLILSQYLRQGLSY